MSKSRRRKPSGPFSAAKGKASRSLGQVVYRRTLERYLSRATDEAFYRMVWAVDAIHTGRAANARKCGFKFDDSLATNAMTPHRVNHWELETLINELLTTPKEDQSAGRQRRLDCGQYGTAFQCARALRKLENAEDRPALDRVGVMSEMHRLTQRQFEWQRGFRDLPTLYRSARIFGEGACAAYFEATYGLTVAEFMHFGLALMMYFSRQPVWDATSSLAKLDISDAIRDKGMALVTTPIAEARRLAGELRKPNLHTAYRPSVLRLFPVARFGERGELITAPIVGLIMHRVTSGLYLDVVGSGSKISNAIGKAFETYALDLLKPMLPTVSVTPERKYRFKKNIVDGTDIEVARDGRLVMAIECKAKRLTFAARFSEDPVTEAGQAYGEIIKGVFQIWRYFSRIRRGLVPDVALGNVPVGMVLTLDPWLSMANTQGRQVMDAARRMCAEKEPEVMEEDQRPILFTSIQELELCLLRGTEDTFFRAAHIAADGEHEAWLLSSIHDKLLPEDTEDRDYPFLSDIARLLPWWPDMTSASSS